MADTTIAASFPSALLEFAVAKGADRPSLIARSKIQLRDLERPDNRIPIDRYAALMDAAIELCNEPALALQFGEAVRFQDISLVGLISVGAKTIAEGREMMNRYARLTINDPASSTASLLELVRDRDGVWLQLNGAIFTANRYFTETAFARNICGARRGLAAIGYLQKHAFPKAIHFTHAEPSYRAEYDRIFGVPLIFDSDRNALLIDEEFLTIELPPTNKYVFGVLSERAESLVKSLENSQTTRGRVERALLPILHTNHAQMNDIASALGMSRATLYRQLKAEGVTFEKVLDELRHQMALHYLNGKKVSINETAYLVGYEDASAFSRAFKRWTGVRPTTRRDG